MRIHGRRVVKLPSWRPGFAALAAVLMLSGAAAAAPTFDGGGISNAPPGILISLRAAANFADAGTNPRITGAVFSDTAYYETHEIRNGHAWVKTKTSAQLNAMSPPPPNPFEVTVQLTMANDEGETASGTLTLRTQYDRNPSGTTTPRRQPTLSATDTFNAIPGVLMSIGADTNFNDAGTNPRFTDAVFSTTEYYDVNRVLRGRIWVQAKSEADLNAMASPPDSPFTVTAEVTMTNDEDQTATATLTFRTTYNRTEPAPQTPSVTKPPPTARSYGYNPRPGFTYTVYAGGLFRNPGTNPRFTAAVFSTTDYYSIHEIRNGELKVQVKTAEQLNAMDSPPDSPFTVTVDLTMTNDEGETATATDIPLITEYDKVDAGDPGE